MTEVVLQVVDVSFPLRLPARVVEVQTALKSTMQLPLHVIQAPAWYRHAPMATSLRRPAMHAYPSLPSSLMGENMDPHLPLKPNGQEHGPSLIIQV
jgi:hypothetical protein